MKILQILPELNVGGVETGTLDFAKYLVAHGHQSLVVSYGGKLVAELERAGSRHYVLPVHKKSFLSMVKQIKPLRKIILDEKVDIVHARSRVPAWIAYFACRKTDASFITTCHGYYKNYLFSQVMGWAKLVIAPSKVIARHMMEDFHVFPEQIRCIPRSVDREKFSIPRTPKTGGEPHIITIVGRVTPLKGHVYFIKAMARVIRSMPNVKVWIIGDAPAKKEFYKREVEVLIRRLGIQDYVEFLGNRQDIPQLLSKTDVLVLSTITQEAFGRVILEAQAAGVPVVATKVGGVVDIIDEGKTGLLVQPKDTEAMAVEVMRLLKDPLLGQRITVEAQKKLNEEFTIEKMASRTLEAYQELSAVKNILVIKLSALGDVILITASLKALRHQFPQARIYCLLGKEAVKILQGCPYLDGLLVYDPKDKGWWKLFKFSSRVRAYKFDKVIDFQNSRRSHLLSFLSFARDTYGFHNGKWSFLLTQPVFGYRNDIPPVEHQFQILEKLGISYKAAHPQLELWPSDKDRQHAQKLLDAEWLGNTRNMVGINIAASARWQTKNWPVEHVAKLCDLLSSKNIRVVLTGMAKDKTLVKKLLSLTHAKPADMTGKTDILQLAALIKKCKVFVTPDSAPLHVAAAMKVPCIAFFGPTDSRRHIPPARKMIIFEKKPVCAPCYSARCKTGTHACLQDITPEEVAEAVEKLMGESN